MHFSESVIIAFLALAPIASASSSVYGSPEPVQPNNYRAWPAGSPALSPKGQYQSPRFPPTHRNYARSAYPEAYTNPGLVNGQLVQGVVEAAGENLPHYISALKETYNTFHSAQPNIKAPSQRRGIYVREAHAYPDALGTNPYWDVAKTVGEHLPEFVEAADETYTAFHDAHEAKKAQQQPPKQPPSPHR